MGRKTLCLAIIVLFLCVIGWSMPLFAQIFGFWRGPVVQNNPPPTEFVIARWHFSTNGRIGNMGWAHNYPEGEIHLNEFIGGVTKIDVDRMSFRIVNLGSDEVFRYPFALVSEPGEMELNPKEISNFREYVERGGFVLIDDFDGPWQFDNFQRQIRQAFPDRELKRLTIDHPVFNTFYTIESLTK